LLLLLLGGCNESSVNVPIWKLLLFVLFVIKRGAGEDDIPPTCWLLNDENKSLGEKSKSKKEESVQKGLVWPLILLLSVLTCFLVTCCWFCNKIII
jgi:hypothetical protein